MTDSSQRNQGELVELALVFLKLGLTAFGGPVAHIALFEQEFVRNRRWLSRDELLDLISASNMIPGPNSTELAIHLGRRRAGFLGSLTAGICFIFPAAAMACGLAWAYVRFGKLPQIQGILYGVKPVIIAIIVQALWRLGRSAAKSRLLGVIGIFGGVLCFFEFNELAILFGTGAFVALIRSVETRGTTGLMTVAPLMGSFSGVPILASAAVSTTGVPFTLWAMALFFLKVGSVLFGSGYVLIVFLKADLVNRLGWISEAQLIDAIAAGQVTPGPIFTTATFIGYMLGGLNAAIIATIAIFIPSFVFVGISAPLIPRLRESQSAAAFLDGANIASLALMSVASWRLGKSAVSDWNTALFFGLAVIVLVRFRVNSVWLVLGGALGGIIFLE